jgi:dolichol-phosphate mannosyltransferase
MFLDRKVVDHIKTIFDPNIYIRGAVFSLGFSKISIPYDRAARASGTSKFSFKEMSGLAFNGIVRQSVWPLRALFIFGILFSFVSVSLALSYLLGRTFFFSNWPPGFATTVIFQMAMIGIMSLFLGVIGEYILRIYVILKGEPMTIIDEVIGGRRGNSKNSTD